MALTKVLTGGIADDAIGNTKLALDANYAFTGTVTGAGVSTATSTLPSEGGAVTTVVAQGLAKQWVNWNAATTIADSLNTTSATDNGDGDSTITIANNMASINFAVSALSKADDNDGVRMATMQFAANQTSIAAGSYRMHCQNSNTGLRDAERQTASVLGDLA
tara:strand:- start:29 stop:517 length:489 start_codon:yes stop_codon:yes gene_type:complete